MAGFKLSKFVDKQTQVTAFSAIAIALYGYDQGMMSLINTNYDYLETMGIAEEDPMVGIIVSVYYLGCAVGAVIASWFSDARGRKPSLFACLMTASLGNAIMFVAGLGQLKHALATMLVGRIVMGLGVGGIDAVVPVYSSELSLDDERGTALAQQFQANIFGLNMAFIINIVLNHTLSKSNEWAWRLPIIIMQIYPFIIFAVASLLPETPRWLVMHDKEDLAKKSISAVFGEDEVEDKFKDLTTAHKEEQEKGAATGYISMLRPSGEQFHPTVVTIMGQVNQALTGYGAVSVYGPQIFELLGFETKTSEFLTLGNYIFYFLMMTFAWLLIDRKGRRWLMVVGAFWLAVSFALLTLLGGLAYNKAQLNIPVLATGIPGIITLYLATSVFGICWLVPPWLIPTELYPSTVRAQGAAISVIIWGLANFAVTLLTPIGFNNLKYGLFLVFCVTNIISGVWTYLYVPESGNRTFEENQEFFKEAGEKGSWRVAKVKDGEYTRLPDASGADTEDNGGQQARSGGNNKNKKQNDQGAEGTGASGGSGQGEREPLLQRSRSED